MSPAAQDTFAKGALAQPGLPAGEGGEGTSVGNDLAAQRAQLRWGFRDPTSKGELPRDVTWASAWPPVLPEVPSVWPVKAVIPNCDRCQGTPAAASGLWEGVDVHACPISGTWGASDLPPPSFCGPPPACRGQSASPGNERCSQGSEGGPGPGALSAAFPVSVALSEEDLAVEPGFTADGSTADVPCRRAPPKAPVTAPRQADTWQEFPYDSRLSRR